MNITPNSNSNKQDVLIIDIQPNERYQIIGIISSHCNDDQFIENDNIEPINLINDFNENNFPQTPNNRIRKRGPPDQKKIYLEAKRLKIIL